MRNQNAKAMAFGGVTAALAVVLGCLAGMIPIATYVIPVLQCMVLQLVFSLYGAKTAWIWYAAVSILGVLLCPDKEAAAMFVFLGYYPIIKPALDKLPASPVWKTGFFLAATAAMYALLICVFGMNDLSEEFRELGLILGGVCLVLGCVTFLLLDKLLTRFRVRRS